MSESGLTGDWDKLIHVLGNNPVKKAVNLARNQIGIVGASMVKKGIQSGAPGGKAFEPLRAYTVWMKGSSKPLIDQADLLGSITHELNGSSGVWIGVRRGARTKDGKDIVNIAAVHEYGCVIPVTPAMRKGFSAKFQGLGIRKDTQYIVIPERSFLRATFDSDEFREMATEKMAGALKRVLSRA
jgi:hypothetical protein